MKESEGKAVTNEEKHPTDKEKSEGEGIFKKIAVIQKLVKSNCYF